MCFAFFPGLLPCLHHSSLHYVSILARSRSSLIFASGEILSLFPFSCSRNCLGCSRVYAPRTHYTQGVLSRCCCRASVCLFLPEVLCLSLSIGGGTAYYACFCVVWHIFSWGAPHLWFWVIPICVLQCLCFHMFFSNCDRLL